MDLLPHPLSKADQVEYLVREKFHLVSSPSAKKQRRSDTGISLATLLASGEEPDKFFANIEAYRTELLKMPSDELRNRVAEAKAAEAKRVREQQELEAQRVRLRLEREERDRPFNQPYAKPGYDYWAKHAYWSPEEFVALSLDRNPGYASWDLLKHLVSYSPFAATYAARRELVMRAKAVGQLWDRTSPETCLSWADQLELAVPNELVTAVRHLNAPAADWKGLTEQLKQVVERQTRTIEDQTRTLQEKHSAEMEMVRKYTALLRETQDQCDALRAENDALGAEFAKLQSRPTEKSLGLRERDSLLKLAIGIAVKKYHYDPKSSRNSATQNIANDLQEVGVPLDVDTVRKYLAEATEHLPD